MNSSPARRTYHSPSRREHAAATRSAIAGAARSLFMSRGWAGTRVRDVAREAGVAEPTVYAVYGSKAGLALALIDAVEAEADPQRTRAEVAAAADPAGSLGAMVASDRRLFEGAGDLVVMLRDGGRAEPALAHAYREGREHGDRFRRQTFTTWPPGTLAPGVDVARAVDVLAALCNVDVWIELRGERGWSADDVQRWWTDTLTAQLLAR